MVCAVCSAARLSTPAPPEPLPHLYASANQLQPEAFVLTAMMTSPITVGGVLVAIGISALVERRSKAKNRL